MRNFKLTLEYEGTHFSGWQTQAPGLRTVQTHIEEALTHIFKSKVHCHASGRTDSGVHALGQVAHVKADTLKTPDVIHKALNSFLDRDISVAAVEEVPLTFHAQNSVKQKTYRYTILNRPYPSALWRNRAYFYPQPLNVKSMKKVAAVLRGKHDFKSFQAAASVTHLRSSVRTVSALDVTRENDFVHISITSDGFLYKMVRNIASVLIAAGVEKLTPKAVKYILNAQNRLLAPKTAPPQGLYLVSVEY